MRHKKYSREQLLLDYINASNRLGRWVSWGHDSFIIAGIKAPISSAYSRVFKSVGELRRLAIKEYNHLLRFEYERTSLRTYNLDKNEFIESYIKKSLQCGYKMPLKDIAFKLKISRTLIIKKLGKIKDIQNEASMQSEEFNKLPTKMKYFKRISFSKAYIQACLRHQKIIGIDHPMLLRHGVPLNSRSIYLFFETVREFREYCASVSPEFAELLANSKFAKK